MARVLTAVLVLGLVAFPSVRPGLCDGLHDHGSAATATHGTHGHHPDAPGPVMGIADGGCDAAMHCGVVPVAPVLTTLPLAAGPAARAVVSRPTADLRTLAPPAPRPPPPRT